MGVGIGTSTVLNGRFPVNTLAGPALVGVGLAPFLIASLAWHLRDGELEGAGLVGCPLREATGIPCAGCGASRAFYFASRGDSSLWSYNWVWPLVAVGVVIYGLVLIWRSLAGHALLGAWALSLRAAYAGRPRLMISLTLGVLLAPWAVALANLDAIRG